MLIWVISFGTVFAQHRQLPNIILLLADDLGYWDLSCDGSTQVQTSNLDKLAAEGMLFTDFYAGSSVYSPSRATLMTGRFSVRAGIYSWIHTSHTMHFQIIQF
jgi:arylsulfatase A